MPDPDDELLFADDAAALSNEAVTDAWKVLIVDDEEQIHAVTKMVLGDFKFRDRRLQFLSAHSGKEGYATIAANPDVAVVFLDVVMETETAGLELAQQIRGALGNDYVRIILRTGQPGQAPERKVIVDYDINDYKEKSELTSQKLFSTMVTALRSYKDIMTIETSRRGLEKIIAASSSLFQIRSMELFLSGVLLQLGSLLEVGIDAVLVSAKVEEEDLRSATIDELQIVAASGRFTALVNRPAAILEPTVVRALQEVIRSRESIFMNKYSLVYFHSRMNRTTALYIETTRQLEPVDHKLIQLFCGNASIGLDMLA
jgi:CheY-like chemotaxis protein